MSVLEEIETCYEVKKSTTSRSIKAPRTLIKIDDDVSRWLDELIEQEEKYEGEKKINVCSVKKLHGQGWSKGFFKSA